MSRRIKDVKGLFAAVERFVYSFVQRAIISYTYFIRNELRNHAAAAAYYMLLSLIPMMLLLFFVFNTFLNKYPNISDELFYILASFSDSLSPEMFSKLGISGKVVGAVGIVGVLNLIWSSRLILLSLQRAFFVIFPSDKKRNFFVENGVSFIVLPTVFLLVLLMAVFGGVKGLLAEYFTFFGILGPILVKILVIVSDVFSGVISFFIVYLSFRYIPVKKPNSSSAVKGSILFLILFSLVKFITFRFFHMFSINTAYGIAGSIIVLLAWAYLVFMIYLYCAQFVFVCYRADILILNMLFSSEKPSALFMRMNKDLLRRYSGELKAGEVLFKQGDKSKEIYYLQSGKLSITINGHKVGNFAEGEIFGEMAHITGEERTATIAAVEDSLILRLRPAEFDEIVKDSHILSRRIMTTLCSRLKHTNNSIGVDI